MEKTKKLLFPNYKKGSPLRNSLWNKETRKCNFSFCMYLVWGPKSVLSYFLHAIGSQQNINRLFNEGPKLVKRGLEVKESSAKNASFFYVQDNFDYTYVYDSETYISKVG